MPTRDGKRLVSESISRDRHHCRIVVTFEVGVDPKRLKAEPNYVRTASDFMRRLVAGVGLMGIMESIVAEWLMGSYVTVEDSKIEVYG